MATVCEKDSPCQHLWNQRYYCEEKSGSVQQAKQIVEIFIYQKTKMRKTNTSSGITNWALALTTFGAYFVKHICCFPQSMPTAPKVKKMLPNTDIDFVPVLCLFPMQRDYKDEATLICKYSFVYSIIVVSCKV